jgi:YVTN family beta-propeller protein
MISKIQILFKRSTAAIFGSLLIALPAIGAVAEEPAKWEEETYHSPNSISVSPQKPEIYVVNQTKDSISVVDLESRMVIDEIQVGHFPTDSCISHDGKYLYLTCLYDYVIQVINLESRKIIDSIPVGYEPYGVILSEDGERLYVANSISRTVSAYSTQSNEKQFECTVAREPRYLVEVPEKNLLIVSNGLSRSASLVDIRTGRLLETRDLNRASILRQTAQTSDSRYAIIAGLIAHDEQITMQIERGWINSNGLYFVDLEIPERFVCVPLDSLLNGAANPWGVTLSSDNKHLYVSLAGTHEIAYVDFENMRQLVDNVRPHEVIRLSQNVEIMDARKMGKRFPTGGLGPRDIVLHEERNELLVANYFTNNISVMDPKSGEVKAIIELGKKKELTLWRKGQMLFNDARLCQQNYYSCASCHQEDATMDGLNWDLVNDGQGNPKNAKSLHDAMDTPPVMWSGVRANMFAGIAAGQRFLGFIPNEDNHEALIEFLGNPRRAPNPYLKEDPAAIARGKELFYRSRCHACHRAPTYTDARKHDLGFRAPFELRSRFYTPSLRECYRTAPYLHNGSADTLEETIIKFNPDNKHGLTSNLTEVELADLLLFLKTL